MIGSKDTFGFVLGDNAGSEFQSVDIWVASELVTYFDNTVHLPTFIPSLEREFENLRNGNVDSDYVYLNHGPTCDDVSARIEIDGNQVFIKCCLYEDDGKILSSRMGKDDLTETYELCIKQLKKA